MFERETEGEREGVLPCESSLSNGDVRFHANTLRYVSLLTAQLLASRRSGPLPPPPSPVTLITCHSQVWYLSGWVCYLQLEKPREQQGGEETTRSEEEEEERRALREAARSYLTNAKKVIHRGRGDWCRLRLGW